MQAADAEAEMELQPETASFRKAQLMRWQSLRDTFMGSHGTRPEIGELRAFLSSALTSAPVNAVAQFVARNQTRWREDSQSILSCYDDVAELITSAYPRNTWSKTAALARDAAADTHVWDDWVRRWSEDVSALSPATGVLLNASGGFLSQIRQQIGAFMQTKGALELIKTIGGVGLQVVLGVEEKRRRGAAGDGDPSPITIESVMREAQCHIPKLQDAIAGFINNEEVSDVLGVLVGTPDLLTSLKNVAGLVPPSRPASPPTMPKEPASDSAPQKRRPVLPAYVPGLDQGDARDWVSTLLVSKTGQAEPHGSADTPVQEAPVVGDDGARSRTPSAAGSRLVDEGDVVAKKLAACEAWAQERSKAIRERGEALAARMDDFLASTGLALHGTPPPGFNDPTDTAAEIAASTVIQTAHFPPAAPYEDSRIQALIDQTKGRLERRYNLDDQFLAWLDERFAAVQLLSRGKTPETPDTQGDGHVAA